MTFFRNILDRLSRGSSGGSDEPCKPDAGPAPLQPCLHLALIGKHAAWDDHIDDIGLDTERLVTAKKKFYLQGVGANVDAGTWDRLNASQKLPKIDHVLLWRLNGASIVGRAIPSSDGKGRSRYPLVAFAECDAMGLDVILEQVAPALDQMLTRCSAAVTQAEVFAAIDETRQALHGLTESPASAEPSDHVDFSPLLACDALGPDGIKLRSVLFQIEREMKLFLPGASSNKTMVSSPAAHLRVPACGLSPMQSSRLWIALVATRIDRNASILAVAPVGQDWVDLIVGMSRPQDFFCLLAAREALPSTTDIPFKMDDAFIARAAQWIETLAGPAMEPASAPAVAGKESSNG